MAAAKNDDGASAPRTAHAGLAVEASGVGRRYRSSSWPWRARSRAVLADVDLELERGAALGLIGPNGSGKSTLLRLLAGVDRPSSGRLRVLGGKTSESRVRARVGYLPEDSPFPRELSARAALELFGSLQGVRPARELRRRIDAWLERVELTSTGRLPLGRFSRGMLRRLGLAQACLHEPELLLLDEPTAGLDAPGYAVYDSILDETRARGAAVVLASHVVDDLLARCDQALLIGGGRVARRATPRELFFERGQRLPLTELYRRSLR